MKLAFAILLGSTVTGMSLMAQNVRKEKDEDPVAAAIRQFERSKDGEGADVKVVLPPPEMPAIGDEATEPVLVTGKAPMDGVLEKEAAEEPSEQPEGEASEPEVEMAQTESETPEGMDIRVEKLQSGSGPVDPASVKLRRPFPPKQSSQAPDGWKVEDQPDAVPISREVDLGNGNVVSLTVRPHVLVPDADGERVFAIQEPGYDPAQGYRQNGTISAILDSSVEKMDDDARRLGYVVDQLQQLLISLPKPEEEAVPKAMPKR